MKRISSAVAGLAVVLGLPAAAAPVPTDLANYRALFDLAIDESSEGVDATDVAGRMAVEFTGSRCSGYRSKMRLVTGGENANGDKQITDARTQSYETVDGRFEFTNQTFINDAIAQESVGEAKRGPGGIEVTLTRPAARVFTLDSAVAFPTEQMNRVLDAARSGDRFLALDVYDGSQSGELVYSTATVIGGRSTAVDDFGSERLIGETGMAALPHWPLTISYFEKSKGTDDTPAYVMSFVAYENGIGRKLRISYGNFALVGKLTHLEMLPTPAC